MNIYEINPEENSWKITLTQEWNGSEPLMLLVDNLIKKYHQDEESENYKEQFYIVFSKKEADILSEISDKFFIDIELFFKTLSGFLARHDANVFFTTLPNLKNTESLTPYKCINVGV